MGVVQEELIRVIKTLTDEQAAALLQVARVIQPETPKKAELCDEAAGDWLDRARAFRMSLEERHGMFPDVVETLDEIWEERLNDISGLR